MAKKEGKFKGQLKKYHKNHARMNYAVKLYKEGGMNVRQIFKITNVSSIKSCRMGNNNRS